MDHAMRFKGANTVLWVNLKSHYAIAIIDYHNLP